MSPVKEMPKSNLTSLHLAIEYGDEEIVEILVKMNVDVNAKEPRLGRTPLHMAVKNDNYEISRMLLNEKASVNAVSDDNLTALHIAVANRSPAMVEMLLYYGADVNPKLKFCGKTPLYMAVEYNSPDILEMLLKEGASIKDATTRNATLFDVAERIGERKLMELLLMYNRRSMPSLWDLIEDRSFPDKHVAKLRWMQARRQIKKNDPLLVKLLKRNALTTVRAAVKDPLF
jgi:ankyrin repeat protein